VPSLLFSRPPPATRFAFPPFSRATLFSLAPFPSGLLPIFARPLIGNADVARWDFSPPPRAFRFCDLAWQAAPRPPCRVTRFDDPLIGEGPFVPQTAGAFLFGRRACLFGSSTLTIFFWHLCCEHPSVVVFGLRFFFFPAPSGHRPPRWAHGRRFPCRFFFSFYRPPAAN